MLDTDKIEKVKFALAQRKRSVKPRSIVLKLGTDCNLRCEYCYVEHSKESNGIEVKTVEKLFDELMEDNNEVVDCCFHGGEPFLYFSKIKMILQMLHRKPYARQIRYSCQSNGTLLTDEIIDFIKGNGISVGISIDGPREVNDLLRKFPNGKGSFDSIVKGIEKLRRNNISFSVLSVISNQNIGYIIDTLTFLKKMGIPSVDLKPCFKTELNEEELSPGLYADAMIKAVDWLIVNNTSESRIIVREIEMYTALVMHREHVAGYSDCRTMCDRLHCGAGIEHITVDTDGDIYICDRLYGHNEYVMGNINREPLGQILKSKLAEIFRSRKISSIEGCRDCAENLICFLGCPATDILQKGDLKAIYSKPDYCEYFSRIIKKLRDVVDAGSYHGLLRLEEE